MDSFPSSGKTESPSFSEGIFEKLNEPQKDAVQTADGPILVLAGAGSGKTRTIVHKIAYLIHQKKVPPYKIVAVTFTNKAASEMAGRALSLCGPEASSVVIRTYHALGLFFLRKLAEKIQYPAEFTIWDDLDTHKSMELALGKVSNEKFTKTQIKYFTQKISSLKNDLVSPEQLREDPGLEEMEYADILPEVYHLYEMSKKESRAVDFGDLIYLPVKIFETHPETLEEISRRYRYFLVDEYQDTNYAQYKLISLLSGQSRNLCVVGDDDQAIYGWRGADVQNILNFRDQFPDAKVIKLEENYRSTIHILNLANRVISNNEGRMEKTLWSGKSSSFISRLYVEDKDRDEAERIVQIIREEARGGKYDHIAVLYRTNSQSRLIEESLLNAKIPYMVYGSISFFARAEIKDMMAYLQLIANPFNEMAFTRVVNTPVRGIGDKTVAKILQHRYEMARENSSISSFVSLLTNAERIPSIPPKAIGTLKELGNWMDDLHNKARKSPDLALLFEDIMIRSGLKNAWEEEDKLLGSSRMDHVMELKSSLINYQMTHPDGRLDGFLQEISLFSSAQEMNEQDRSGVHLMTIHNAKGLEFDTVILSGMEDTMFPHFFALQEGRLDEERRLAYVAITRAKNRLYMTRARTRMKFSGVETMSPSVFLAEIGLTNLEVFEAERKKSSGYYPGDYSNGGYSGSYSTPKRAPIPEKKSFPNTVGISSGTNSGSALKKGVRVKHPAFGTGTVLTVEGSGDAAKVHIHFKSGQAKKFLVKFASLEIL